MKNILACLLLALSGVAVHADTYSRVLQWCLDNNCADLALDSFALQNDDKGDYIIAKSWKLACTMPDMADLPSEADSVNAVATVKAIPGNDQATDLKTLGTDITALITEIQAQGLFTPEQEGEIVSILKLVERLRVLVGDE